LDCFVALLLAMTASKMMILHYSTLTKSILHEV